MKVICVDDEIQSLRETVSVCSALPQVSEVNGFSSSGEALEWLREHTANAAVLDIRMPDMDGLELAARIRERYPETAVIFLTAHAGHALEAFGVHASGYLLKPAGREQLYSEIEYIRSGRMAAVPPHIRVTTFGNFDIRVDGKNVAFSRARAKELLAYLVDRQGSSITRAEAFALLWEEGIYDRSKQKQLDVIIRSMRDTLQKYRISEIVEMKNGTMRIRPELLDCDLYRFLEGDLEAVNAFRGEYMNAYSWSSITEAYMDRIGRGN